MPIEFKIEGQNGQAGRVDANYVLNQLQQGGYNPQGLSADGLKLTLQDAQGPYEIKTADALQNLGWKVNDATPMNADYENVQPGWRAAVHKLPDDDTRRAYIEGQLRKVGVEAPQITGAGRDWYVFNPQTSQWIGVTNSPDWDTSDLVEAGLEAPRAIGAALGGAGGAILGGGPASLATGPAGAATGGAGVDFIERSALAHGYPGLFEGDDVYRDVVGKNLGATAVDMAGKAGLDAATQGAFQGVPMLAKAVSPKLGNLAETLVEASPISRSAQTVGAGAQMIGGGAKGLAKAVDTPLGRDLLSVGLPLAGDMSAAGFLAQAPSYLSTAGVKGLGKLGESGLAQRYAPKAASWMRRQSDELSRGSDLFNKGFAEEAQGFASNAANAMRGKMGAEYGPRQATPSVIYENLGRKAHIRGGELLQKFKNRTQRTPLEDIMARREGGESMLDALGEVPFERELAQRTMGSTRGADMGRRFGQVMENVNDLGAGLQRGASAMTGAALKGVRAGGAATQGTGTALRAGGTFAKPLETRAYARYGSEEGLRQDMEELNPLRRRRPSYMIGSELAQN
jgi:hypothetical protein